MQTLQSWGTPAVHAASLPWVYTVYTPRCVLMLTWQVESEPRDQLALRRMSTDKSRTSGETYRSHSESAKQSGDAPLVTWNPCASGCGCKCRVVVGLPEAVE